MKCLAGAREADETVIGSGRKRHLPCLLGTQHSLWPGRIAFDLGLLNGVGPMTHGHIVDARLRAESRKLIGLLTPRETDVLEEIVAGGSNESIGRKLGLSRRSVDLDRASLMRKLNAGSPADAVRIALHAGLGETRQRPR